MFEIPSAKRVKRSQLFNSDDENENDVATGPESIDNQRKAKTKMKSRRGKHDDDNEEQDVGPVDYGFEYDFVTPDPATTTTVVTTSNTQEESKMKVSESTTQHWDRNPDPNAETYSFNLFAPVKSQLPKPTTTTTNIESTLLSQKDTTDPRSQPPKISLRSPSPTLEIANSRSFPTSRPQSHYFTCALPTSTIQTLKQSYLASAITVETLQILSRRAWPGVACEWRVIGLPTHNGQVVVHKPSASSTTLSSNTITTKTSVVTQISSMPTRISRSRPSKKRRDFLRLKSQRRQILIDDTKTKEEHEKEKRNKKNRERKLKRRAKERREKEEGRVEGSVEVGGNRE